MSQDKHIERIKYNIKLLKKIQALTATEADLDIAVLFDESELEDIHTLFGLEDENSWVLLEESYSELEQKVLTLEELAVKVKDTITDEEE